MQYIIQKAEAADFPEIFELQHLAYLSEAQIYNDYTIQPLTQSVEEAAVDFQSGLVLKAVSNVDGRIIGSVRAHQVEGSMDSIQIGKLMVHPDFQNQGLGRHLLQAIEAEFAESTRQFELFTGAHSEKNITLYEKSGYSKYTPEPAAHTEPATNEYGFVYMRKPNPNFKTREQG